MAEGTFVPAKVSSVRHSGNPGLLQRQCGCGGSAGLKGECESCRGEKLEGMQMKLAVGRPGDSYEQEADRVADRVMSMSDAAERPYRPAPVTQVPVQAMGRYSQGDGGGAEAPAIVHEVVNSPGRPLDAGTRAFMESRFGHDFGRVRVHTNSRAAESARAVNALAYTVGSNVAFGAGMYAPGTESGRRLLAHELTHTIQQQAAPRSLQRTVVVDDPSAMIPNPTGAGVVQSNAATIQNYLTMLCPNGGITVNGTSGQVDHAAGFCSMSPGAWGLAFPILSLPPSLLSSTPAGCGCLCDMIASPHTWTIVVDDVAWPNTVFDNNRAANGRTRRRRGRPAGSGGTVTAPSPNSPRLWGAGTASGGTVDIPAWLVLGHELCGHGWLGNSGRHGPDHRRSRGHGGHQETVARENLLRAEHGIERRGTFREPNCGESYWRDRAAPATVNWSSYWNVCREWRKRYNKRHGTSYTMSDTIP